MSLIVITGGIGAGKSTVLEIFAKMGYFTVDADIIVHQIYAEDFDFIKLVKERWGMIVLDKHKNIIREKIAQFVFQQPEEIAWLNQVLHERVKNRILEIIHQKQMQIVFVAIPLYYEVKWDFADFVISVWCSKEKQQNRLEGRGWSKQHINERLSHQFSAEYKLEHADFGIINNGDLDFLKEQCNEILKIII